MAMIVTLIAHSAVERHMPLVWWRDEQTQMHVEVREDAPPGTVERSQDVAAFARRNLGGAWEYGAQAVRAVFDENGLFATWQHTRGNGDAHT